MKLPSEITKLRCFGIYTQKKIEIHLPNGWVYDDEKDGGCYEYLKSRMNIH